MKTLTIFAVSLLVLGISLSSFIPGFSMSSMRAYIASANLIVNALVSVSFFISLNSVNWKEKEGTISISEVTKTWFDSLAFVALMMSTVIVPMATIFFEATTHTFGVNSLDLIPTPWHIMLVALGPVLNAFCAGLLFQKVDIEPKTVNFINGLALGIALPFVVATVQLMKLAALAIATGMVWMLFSAVLAFLGTIKLFDLLMVFYPSLKGFTRTRIIGLLTGIALLFLAQTPIWLTNLCTVKIVKEPNSQVAIQMIKLFGDKHYLLRKCYLSGNLSSINEAGLPVINTSDAQIVFKKVTGKDYKSIAKPLSVEREEARELKD